MDQIPHIAQWLISYGAVHDYLVYGLIIILACAEGPWLSLIFGILIRLGDFGFWPVYIALMAGDLIGDVIWYEIGRRYGHSFIARYGKYFNITEAGVGRMSKLFHRYKDSVLFLSKISNGLGFALVTLMTAGMVRIPFGRYLAINLLGQFIWTGFLLGVGYWFSHLYITIDNLLGRMTLVAAVIIAATLLYRFWKYLRTKAQALGDDDSGPKQQNI
ncbi:MAG: DedA family protein [Patescibacteria group bacterium]|nr:DedA family protein [Patescibacteria group bacterium]